MRVEMWLCSLLCVCTLATVKAASVFGEDAPNNLLEGIHRMVDSGLIANFNRTKLAPVDKVMVVLPATSEPIKESQPSLSQQRSEPPSTRHPYTEFLNSGKGTKLEKKPLDYGYPDSFKFIQELNDLPKNHKPLWDTTKEVQTTTIDPAEFPSSSKGNPFEMFESVKPLEINKLLSAKHWTRLSNTTTEKPRTFHTYRVGEITKEEDQHHFSPSTQVTPTPPLPEKIRRKKPLKRKPTRKPIERIVTPSASLPPTNTVEENPIISAQVPYFLPTPYEITTKYFPISTSPMPSTKKIYSAKLQPVTEETSTTESPETSSSATAFPTFKPLLQASPGQSPPLSVELNGLNPQVRDMLAALGILTEANAVLATTTSETTTEARRLSANIDAESYAIFKKIPIKGEEKGLSSDMKEFLESFGLLPKGPNSALTRVSRQEKLPKDSKDMYTIAIPGSKDSLNLTENMKNTLEDLGLLNVLPVQRRDGEKEHVFRPSTRFEQFDQTKINDLIQAIKTISEDEKAPPEQIKNQLENITASFKLEQQRRENNATGKTTATNTTLTTTPQLPVILVVDKDTDLNTAQDLPNPLSTEELQHLYESEKNAYKRQEPNGTTEATTTTEISTEQLDGSTDVATEAASESPSTEETRSEAEVGGSAPLPDLAASFGGGETASSNPAQDGLPTPRPNGLYFYVDWNSFFRVGETDKNPVNIRFSPRAGNARNFIPITFP